MNVDDELRTVLDDALAAAGLEVDAGQRAHVTAALNEMYWLGRSDSSPELPVVSRAEDLHIQSHAGVHEDPVVQLRDRRSGQVLVRLPPEQVVTVARALTTAATQAHDLAAPVRAGEAELGGSR